MYYNDIYKNHPSKYFNDYFDTSWYYETVTYKDGRYRKFKDGFDYKKWEDDYVEYLKGKDNNMTQITVDINCNGGMSINPNVFYISEPKFKVGDKVKHKNTYGVVDRVETNIKIHRSDKATKYQRDQNNWIYSLKYESGYTIGIWHNVKEDELSKDDRSETNKYFDFLDKQGVKLDRTRYTWKTFSQTVNRTQAELRSGYFVYGSKIIEEITYIVSLCDKNTNKIVKFEGTQVGTDKLPAISEKC